MNQIDRGLIIRETQLKEALELLTAKHGAQSETVGVIRRRLNEVQEEISEDKAEIANKNPNHTDDFSRFSTMPHVKDATLLYVIIGGILIFAVGGLSSMFILMLAVHW